MQTLGVSSPERQEDNFFQRLFWPSVTNQYDVELAGKRAFWIAFVVGVLTFVALFVLGSFWMALLSLAVFVLGAAGMRQRSVTASILICLIYVVGKVLEWIAALAGNGHASGDLVSLVCMALLLTCVRASFLSREFAAEGDTEFPDSDNTGFLAKLSNRFPRIVWPRFRVAFFALAGLYLALTILGGIYMVVSGVKHAHAAAPSSASVSTD